MLSQGHCSTQKQNAFQVHKGLVFRDECCLVKLPLAQDYVLQTYRAWRTSTFDQSASGMGSLGNKIETKLFYRGVVVWSPLWLKLVSIFSSVDSK